MMKTMKEAIALAHERGIAIPHEIVIYMDDIWYILTYPPPLPPPRRPGLRSATAAEQQQRNPASDFQDCLNSIHPRVQFTVEEEENEQISFLDILIQREECGNLKTSLYRKPSETFVTIKPNLCQHSSVPVATIKGQICRAHCIFSNENERE